MLLWSVCVYLVTQSCPTLCDPVDCSPSVHGDSPDKNTGVGCHALLQGIFQTQGSNLCLLCCRRILYHLSHQGSPGYWKSLLARRIYDHPSLLQGIFLTQESNQGLLNCKQILYQLSSQGSPQKQLMPLEALLGGLWPKSNPSWLWLASGSINSQGQNQDLSMVPCKSIVSAKFL